MSRQVRIICLALFLALTGCSVVRQVPWLNRQFYYPHQVTIPGETVSIIASWYTGSPRNWTEILDHNPGLDPHKIQLGTWIYIPRSMLVREDQLPERFVVKIREPKKRKPSAPPAKDEYPYKVNTIRGCEDLPNSDDGLMECAARVDREMLQGKSSEKQ